MCLRRLIDRFGEPLPNAIELKHGPVRILARLVLNVWRAGLDQGVRLLVFHHPPALEEIVSLISSGKNREQLAPNILKLDVGANAHQFLICGIFENKDIVFAQASRISDIAEVGELLDPLSSLAPDIHGEHGIVHLASDIHVADKYRSLANKFVRAARAYAFGQRSIDWAVSYFRSEPLYLDLPFEYGFSRVFSISQGLVSSAGVLTAAEVESDLMRFLHYDLIPELKLRDLISAINSYTRDMNNEKSYLALIERLEAFLSEHPSGPELALLLTRLLDEGVPGINLCIELLNAAPSPLPRLITAAAEDVLERRPRWNTRQGADLELTAEQFIDKYYAEEKAAVTPRPVWVEQELSFPEYIKKAYHPEIISGTFCKADMAENEDLYGYYFNWRRRRNLPDNVRWLVDLPNQQQRDELDPRAPLRRYHAARKRSQRSRHSASRDMQ